MQDLALGFEADLAVKVHLASGFEANLAVKVKLFELSKLLMFSQVGSENSNSLLGVDVDAAAAETGDPSVAAAAESSSCFLF